MQITITDGKNTLTLENSEPMSSEINKKLIDILFTRDKAGSKKAQVTAEVSRIPEVARVPFPADPERFEGWLNSEEPGSRADQLSKFVESDITLCSNMHSMARTVPGFASKLGYTRYLIAARWLCDQGYLNYMPSDISMRAYYSKSLRIARYESAS